MLKGINVHPASNPLKEWNNIEFYGQRPWRLMKILNNAEYDSIETDGVQALQFYENTKVDHSVRFSVKFKEIKVYTIFYSLLINS